MPETTRLAETAQAWWPEIEAFLRLRITNARTEGGNRVIKQIKRVGCDYGNQANYERLSSCTSPPRKRRDSDQRGSSPSNAKSHQTGRDRSSRPCSTDVPSVARSSKEEP
jgi:hypothetical protein